MASTGTSQSKGGSKSSGHAKAIMVQLTTFAEDRDPSQDDWSRSSDSSEEQGGGTVETKPDLPGVSSFSNSPCSAGSTV
jgi:hypothetical protein